MLHWQKVYRNVLKNEEDKFITWLLQYIIYQKSGYITTFYFGPHNNYQYCFQNGKLECQEQKNLVISTKKIKLDFVSAYLAMLERSSSMIISYLLI